MLLLLLLLRKMKKMYKCFIVERKLLFNVDGTRSRLEACVFQKRYPSLHPVRFYSTFFITTALYPKTLDTW